MQELKIKRNVFKNKDQVVGDTPTQLVAYCNLSQMTLAPEEAMLHFGIRGRDNANEAQGVAKIYLSLSHIKRIAVGLGSLIQQYEEIFGEIPLDPASRLTEKGRILHEEIEAQAGDEHPENT